MMAKRKRDLEPPVEIRLLQLEHALAVTSVERKRIRDINRSARDLVAVRMRGGPIASLADRRRIGPDEIQAAQDIEKAFTALTIGQGFKPLSLERKDKSANPESPVAVLDAIQRYQTFANYWSGRKVRGDRSFEILIAAVIDERSLSAIEDDVGIRNGMAGKVVVRMLRDYAARAGWVTSRLAAQWKLEAEESFKLKSALTLAAARHRAVKAEEVA